MILETLNMQDIQAMSQDTKTYPSSIKLVSILLSLALGIFLVAINIAIISVAVPKISTDFKAL